MTTTIFDKESMMFSPLDPEKLFIAKIRDYHRITATHYYDPRVQEKVRSFVPWESMTRNASMKAMSLSSTSRGKSETPFLDARDLFIVELVDWFKNSFFSWFNKSICDNSYCPLRGVEMESIGSGQPNHEDLAYGASRIELYQCASCKKESRFPRYNHPLKLLDTRTGRCGEWANVFTCICTILGYDARLVLDWTDHVWTEIFSESQSRWIHIDSCEAAIDAPLTYEKGWNKSLSYCIAISKFEIQDVTWRYSLKEPKELFNQRRDCKEEWLVNFIPKMNEELQSTLNPEKKREITIRTLNELLELLWTPWKENKLKTMELQGRQSGAESWRKARNEIGSSTTQGYTFVLKEDDFSGNYVNISFNAVRDKYALNRRLVKEGWKECLHSCSNISKKIEHDWKMVYLARTEGSPAQSVGELSWKLDLSQLKHWSSISVLINGMIYDNANIEISFSQENSNQTIPIKINEEVIIQKDQLITSLGTIVSPPAAIIIIRARLSGGSLGGNLSWQKAQLFRQSLVKEADNDSMVIKIFK
jgi:peptide-N4-(N-acetyl-beta-glucosaminyl)asparagine amidase